MSTYINADSVTMQAMNHEIKIRYLQAISFSKETFDETIPKCEKTARDRCRDTMLQFERKVYFSPTSLPLLCFSSFGSLLDDPSIHRRYEPFCNFIFFYLNLTFFLLLQALLVKTTYPKECSNRLWEADGYTK